MFDDVSAWEIEEANFQGQSSPGEILNFYKEDQNL